MTGFGTHRGLVRLLSHMAFLGTVVSWSSPRVPSTVRAGVTLTMTHDHEGDHDRPMPHFPLPPPIRSDTPGTWAYDTMSRRIREEILERTYRDNADTFEAPAFHSVRQEVLRLGQELEQAADTPLTYLLEEEEEDHHGSSSGGETCETYRDPHADNNNSSSSSSSLTERAQWNQHILPPHVTTGATWLSAPWLVAEFYLYRRYLQALGYFDPRSPGYQYDPFAVSKRNGLVSSTPAAEPILRRMPQLVAHASIHEGVRVAAEWALWGNRMDLSLWPAPDETNNNNDDPTNNPSTRLPDESVLQNTKANEYLLANDAEPLAGLCAQLHAQGGGNIDIIVDNAGLELVTDLALAQYLVQSGVARCVTFQLKSHPTFVSDAMEKDLRDTVDYYANLDSQQYPGAAAAGRVWRDLLASGHFVCHEHPFWCQPLAMWDMTEPLRTDTADRCDLAFVKGDANYRRLLGDCMWDMTLPFQSIVGAYFPCPVCALRTLKAEIGCGMAERDMERAKAMDKDWMVNGRFGVIHFGTGAARAGGTSGS